MNTSSFIRFILRFIIYLIVIGCLSAYPLYKYGNPLLWRGVIANTILFFFLTTISVWLVMRRGDKGQGMLNAFLASMGIKMAISLVYFWIFLNEFKGHELQFAFTFFGVYLVCTCFEVYYLLHNLRQI